METHPKAKGGRVRWKTFKICFLGLLLISLLHSYQGSLELLTLYIHNAKGDTTKISVVDSYGMGSNENSNIKTSDSNKPVANIAYQLVLSGCKPRKRTKLINQAAVLKHSIEISSYPLHPTSKYAATFYATMPPELESSTCAVYLQKHGFNLRVLPLPVTPEQIDNSTYDGYLSKSIWTDGCCGHSELMKLHTYTFDSAKHPIAINLDFDTLLLKPFDTLFDTIMYPPNTEEGRVARENILKEGYIAPTYNQMEEPVMDKTFNAFYTKDYNMITRGFQERYVGMQGGFLMVRTNQTEYETLVDIVKSGDFKPGRNQETVGWKQSGYGMHIWGALTIQGLLAYFNNEYRLTHVELNRCMVNQIADNPRRTTFHGRYPRPSAVKPNATWSDTTCRDGRDNCDDVQCQNWPIENTTLVHYTYCKDAMDCRGHIPVEEYEYLNEYACTDICTKHGSR